MINTKIFYLLNGLAGETQFLDSLIVFFAATLPWIVVGTTLVYLLFIKKNLNRFFMIFFCVGVATFVAEVFKWVVFRAPRPFVALSDVTQLIQISPFDSFPSTHATIFSALATVVFIYNRKKGIALYIVAGLIGTARVAAGVHFPGDILTGFVLGIVITFISYELFRRLSIMIRKFIS
jgi:undecaprenyl-diphosphatase